MSEIKNKRISCSQLFRYFICPSALNHEQVYVKKDVKDEYQKEGIDQHLEIQRVIESNVNSVEPGSIAYILQQEMLKLDPNFTFSKCKCEIKLSEKDVTPGYDLVGQPDLVYMSQTLKTFFICDYKFGYTNISVEKNLQLLGYAYLWKHMVDRDLPHLIFETFSITVCIFQDGILNTKELCLQDLLDFQDELFSVFKLSEQHQYNPQPTACKHCNHRESCKVLLETVGDSVKKISSTELHTLSDDDIFSFRKQMVQKKKLIEHVLGDSENFFKNGLKNGGIYDFCSLKSNGSMQSWTDELSEEDIAAILREKTGAVSADAFFDRSLKSVSSIKKLLGDIPKELLISKEKAKSLKVKEATAFSKDVTEDLF